MFNKRVDEAKYACAIEFDGITILHLMAGTIRNERNIDMVVSMLNVYYEKFNTLGKLLENHD